MTVHQTPPATAAPAPEPAILVAGEHVTLLDDAALASLSWRERTVQVNCASGDVHEATWAGPCILDVLELAGPPADTTHVVVTAGDDYRVCIDLPASLDGLLAITRNGVPLAEIRPYASRLVVPGIDGARTAKDVRRVEPVALSPGTDPETLEDLHLGER